MTILLSPHNDDEVLFAAYTLMREKPLVIICTDGYLQRERGLNITAKQRRDETREAMGILGLSANFLHIRDTNLTEGTLTKELRDFISADKIYAPAIEGYQKQHDLVGEVADKLWPGKVTHYMTYTASDLHTKGSVEITPTQQEMDLKNKALDCYVSQIKVNGPHFDAVRNLPEYYA